jgi:hypothetical protein
MQRADLAGAPLAPTNSKQSSATLRSTSQHPSPSTDLRTSGPLSASPFFPARVLGAGAILQRQGVEKPCATCRTCTRTGRFTQPDACAAHGLP